MTGILEIGFDVPFDEAIQAAVERGVVLPEQYYGELQGIARQLAFSVAGIASLDQLQAVADSLSLAVGTGLSFDEWRKTQTVESLGLPKHRLDNIYRTNLQGNFQAGTWEKIVEYKEERPYAMYDAINDSRVRPSHLAMDGAIRPIDDPWFKSHAPPNGYRCRCSVIQLSREEANARSGPDTGLNKNPVNPDGTSAEPDPGWDYSPRDRLAGVNQAMRDRLNDPTINPELLAAFKKRIANAIYTNR